MSADSPAPVRVFLPGWGFDACLPTFAGLAGWWAPTGDPAGWPAAIDACLHGQEEGRRLELAGWSMGAGIALSYALAHPDRVSRLILLSLRAGWPRAELDAIRKGLAIDCAGFMTDFYRKCLAGDRDTWQRFAAAELHRLLAVFTLNRLVEALGQLEDADRLLRRCRLPGHLVGRIYQVHGRRDLIAPLADIAQLPGVTPVILPHVGHGLPFNDECRGFLL